MKCSTHGQGISSFFHPEQRISSFVNPEQRISLFVIPEQFRLASNATGNPGVRATQSEFWGCERCNRKFWLAGGAIHLFGLTDDAILRSGITNDGIASPANQNFRLHRSQAQNSDCVARTPGSPVALLANLNCSGLTNDEILCCGLANNEIRCSGSTNDEILCPLVEHFIRIH